MLAPIAWRTPPRHYGPWERVTSLLTESLVEMGVDVTLFATADSLTAGEFRAVAPAGYEEDRMIDARVWGCLHISEVFEHASEFDLIHNHFDFVPLSYSALVETPVLTTIHGFSSATILPVYRKYNGRTWYVSISDADRAPGLDYIATIHHGIDFERFSFHERPGEYLLYFGRIHHDKGAREAIEIARRAGRRLVMAGIIQDEAYYEREVKPWLDRGDAEYIGSVGPDRRDAVLGGAAALLHPINFDEPFGLSVVESMACGTPVIAFNRGSMPELIEHGRNGFLVDAVEGAVAALDDLASIDRYECRLLAERRFARRRMAEQYVEVYEKIIARSRNRRSVGYAGLGGSGLSMNGNPAPDGAVGDPAGA